MRKYARLPDIMHAVYRETLFLSCFSVRLDQDEIVYRSMPLYYFRFAFCLDGWFHEPLFAPSLKRNSSFSKW